MRPEERPMHAVIVNVTIEDFEKARANLREETVPQVSQAPGFVTGSWLRLAEDRGMAVLVFESEQAASGARERVQAQPAVGVTFDSVEVHEVVEHA